ncbi:MAG: glycosyl hydrolase, partial [Candidatus Hydrogenedentes bacterium]|nr:glycosyl hydrolase [Candidatus Hydrogenedentota bacterium]
LFNTNDGNYRCPSTQQGYSPFSTWTRGLAWVLLGCAEELECLSSLPEANNAPDALNTPLQAEMERAAQATAEFYIAHTHRDGIPFWDTDAPGLAKLEGYQEVDSQSDNPYEPVDSSAAAIAAQGLLRLGRYLGAGGARYVQAGLTVARTLFSAPYLAEDPGHHGLLLHSVYHRPNGWDYVPPGKQVPHGESSMWGDYHAMELALYLRRIQCGAPYLTFFCPTR